MFRSQFAEEEVKYASNKGQKLLNSQQQGRNGSARPPITITYVSPPTSPTAGRNQFEERAEEPTSRYTSMDNQRDDAAYSYKGISDKSLARLKKLDPAHPMIAGNSRASTKDSHQGTQGTQALDLKHNDNAFHIVADLIVARFEEQLTSDDNVKSIIVKAGDMYHMERVVPDKKIFIEAVQYRVINCPLDSTKPIHEITRRCQALGLDLNGSKNLLFAPIGAVFEIIDTNEPTKIRQVNTDAIKFAKPNTLDDMARQQITTELLEAKTLMAESVTPEASEFWRKQVLELEAKLLALEDGETMPADRDMSYFKTEQGVLSTLWQTIGYTPPILEKQDSEKSEAVTTEDPEKGIELINSDAAITEDLEKGIESGELPIVDVVAPSDLPGGYKFEAELNGKRFLATVPNGGVLMGKTFYCYMEPVPEFMIPVGGWRDSPLDMFKHGYKHPMVLASLLCPLLGLSQVMERLGLDITGKKASSDIPDLLLYTPRGMALSMLFVWAGLNVTILSGLEIKAHSYLVISLADMFSLFLVNASLLAFTVYATINTRQYIMEQFQIPNHEVGSRIETILAAVFFPISIAQMGRHTASYEACQAVFCHPTGIEYFEESSTA